MIRLAIRVAAEQAELVLAELLELAPHGVEERAAGLGVVEYAVYGAPGELPTLPDVRAAAGGALVEVSSREVADDWAERWRQYHRPLVLPGRLTVRPPWEPMGQTPLDLVIDPGMAFGTGAHATTRLCLELLLELADAGGHGSLLDLGCGSGVLAITAARLGFGPVLAADHDPLSVQATAANAAANQAEVQVTRIDLRTEPLPATATVLANLLRPLLRRLAERMRAGEVPRPAHLIASGLLAAEADELVAAFTLAGLGERDRRTRGEWAALWLEQAAGAAGGPGILSSQ